jgi:hypothetical protein
VCSYEIKGEGRRMGEREEVKDRRKIGTSRRRRREIKRKEREKWDKIKRMQKR